jgi:hypothetical protein
VKIFGRVFEGFAQALVILVAVFLVSTGLCGATLFLQGPNGGILDNPHTAWEIFLADTGGLSMLAMIFSLAGIVIVFLIWILDSVFNLSGGLIQKLFDNKSDGNENQAASSEKESSNHPDGSK